MSKVIVHIDLNAFFVRAEEIKDPSLENKAVAVGHLGRAGIVSTCSYEARKYGVRSGMPMNKAIKLCPDLIIKPGDYHYYYELSQKFKNIVRRYTPLIESASIDEVYADFTKPLKGVKDVSAYFRNFQKVLFDETKLKCSIGVGTTKFVAKMGSDYQKPNGLTIIHNKEIKKILFPLPIEDMFGIGKKTAPRLRSVNINTIGDLYNAINNKDELVLNILGKFSYDLLNWLEGKSSDEIVLVPDDPKSISHSTTLEEDTTSLDIIFEAMNQLAKEISTQAKKEDKVGATIQIMAKDNFYKAHNKSITLASPTNDYLTIFNTASKLYEKNYSSLLVRAVGIALQNLMDVKDISIQMTLFDYQEHIEQSHTKLLISDLNRKLKKPILKRLSEVKKNENR